MVWVFTICCENVKKLDSEFSSRSDTNFGLVTKK